MMLLRYSKNLALNSLLGSRSLVFAPSSSSTSSWLITSNDRYFATKKKEIDTKKEVDTKKKEVDTKKKEVDTKKKEVDTKKKEVDTKKAADTKKADTKKDDTKKAVDTKKPVDTKKKDEAKETDQVKELKAQLRKASSKRDLKAISEVLDTAKKTNTAEELKSQHKLFTDAFSFPRPTTANLQQMQEVVKKMKDAGMMKKAPSEPFETVVDALLTKNQVDDAIETLNLMVNEQVVLEKQSFKSWLK
jgi:hypothetical protein